MTGCTISDSYTSYEPGGGIFAADNSRLTITDSSIVGNQAFGDVGGGIATGANVALTVRDSQFFDNFSYYGGGAIDLSGSLSMEDSTVSRNNGDRRRRTEFYRYGHHRQEHDHRQSRLRQ